MKKWLPLIVALAAVGILSRLPHPAKDISRLEPVQTVWLHMKGGQLCVETDTGERGSGKTLTEAAAAMRLNADREIFLETAEFLILHPEVPVAEDFFTHLRPGCRVVITPEIPDLHAASQYLLIHTPQTTLAHLRAP